MGRTFRGTQKWTIDRTMVHLINGFYDSTDLITFLCWPLRRNRIGLPVFSLGALVYAVYLYSISHFMFCFHEFVENPNITDEVSLSCVTSLPLVSVCRNRLVTCDVIMLQFFYFRALNPHYTAHMEAAQMCARSTESRPMLNSLRGRKTRTHCGGNIASVIMFPKCWLVVPRAQHLCPWHILANVAAFCHRQATSQDAMLPPQCVLVLPGPYFALVPNATNTE